jgi:hypothetical protein
MAGALSKSAASKDEAINIDAIIKAVGSNQEMEEEQKGEVSLQNIQGCQKISFNRSINDKYLLSLAGKHDTKIDPLSTIEGISLDFESYSKITDASLVALFPKFPLLKSINLKSCIAVSDKTVQSIVEHCKKLEEIDLSWCEVSEKSLFYLSQYGNNLRKVGVRSCYITDRSVKQLTESCTNIKHLSLAWCKSLTDNALTYISNNLNQLEFLDIRGNERFTSNGLSTLMKSIPNIKVLHLKRVPAVNDEVLYRLAKGASLLEKLNLRGCYKNHNISNGAILAIAESCSYLQSIDLAWHDYLDDKALITLASSCKDLDAIDLSGCILLSDESIKALANHCPKLRKVILFNNPHITNMAFDLLINKNVELKIF